MIDRRNRENKSSVRISGLGWRGGILQLIFVTVLPLTVLLLLITFGSITIHQRAMRMMVGERDERAVRTAAAMSAQIDQRAASILSVSQQVASKDQGSLDEVLARSSPLLRDFDGGLSIFDQNGTFLASIGDNSLWQALAAGTGTNIRSFFLTRRGRFSFRMLFAIRTGVALSSLSPPLQPELEMKKVRPLTWYQTGPYWTYYYTGRCQDVIDLATKTLDNSSEPVLEESFY